MGANVNSALTGIERHWIEQGQNAIAGMEKSRIADKWCNSLTRDDRRFLWSMGISMEGVNDAR